MSKSLPVGQATKGLPTRLFRERNQKQRTLSLPLALQPEAVVDLVILSNGPHRIFRR